MEIILYPGEKKNQLDYFTFFFDTANVPYEINHCYFGYKILAYTCDDKIDNLASQICRFIFDFYLKEAVISKIYDEYSCFNTDEASLVLSKLSDKIVSVPIKDNILDVLKNKKSFNTESYCLFNIKPIMICVYALTDEICQSLIFSKEKERFVSMVQMFSRLSFDKCLMADVEFSLDNKCRVAFDEKPYFDVSNDELLALLAQKSPGNVNIKNADISPELADIVEEIFNSEKNK